MTKPLQTRTRDVFLVLLMLTLILSTIGCDNGANDGDAETSSLRVSKEGTGAYQLISGKGYTFLLDSSTGRVWIKGGTLNGVQQWHAQKISGTPEGKASHGERYRLLLEEDSLLFDTWTGRIWEMGGTVNGVRQWYAQKIPGLSP